MLAPSDRRLIAIEGLPGSGHTALARWIGSRPEWYADCEDHAPATGDAGTRHSPLSPLLQRLLDRFERSQALLGTDLFRDNIVTDYTFDTHSLWARALLPESDWTLYRKIAAVLLPAEVRPDLVVYLQAPETKLLPTLRTWGRNIDTDRWRELIAAYNHYFFAYERTSLLVVRTSSADWLSTDTAKEALWQRIGSFPGGKTYLIGEADFWQGGKPAGD